MICKRSIPGLIAEWKKLRAAVQAHEIELPLLEPFGMALEEALEDVRIAKARQVSLEAQRRQATRDLHDSIDATRELVMRLLSLVKGSLGRMDSRLPDFGIKPFRLRSLKPSEQVKRVGSPGVH